MSYYVFFDLDHTILDINSGKTTIQLAAKQKLMRRKEIVRAWFLLTLFKLKLIDAVEIMDRMVKWLTGVSEADLENFSIQMFNDSLQAHIRSKAIEEIEYHKSLGAKIVLLSASTKYTCQPIGEYLKLDGVICSELELQNGYFTGKFNPHACYAENKKKCLQRYVQKNKVDIKSAWYYGDEEADISVFQIVGKAVCINPKSKLKRRAQEENWTVYNW